MKAPVGTFNSAYSRGLLRDYKRSCGPSFEAVVQQPDKSGNVGKNAEMCGQRGDGAGCCSRGAAGGGHNTAEY